VTVDANPRVTVGLAVYNGERYLAASIESILNQTFDNLELVICDNDSSDRTEEICRHYAAADRRVRYYRNPQNIGGVRNENRTFFLARGEFFKLAAHDDLMSLNFLEVSVAALDANPAAELVTPSVVVIDGDGAELPTTAPIAGIEPSPAARIRALVDRRYMCEATYGVARTSALRAIRPQGNFLHSDRIVLCELAIRAPFLFAPDAIFYRRLHTGNMFQDWRGRMSWFQPELKRSGRIRLPHWRLLGGYAGMLGRSNLPLGDRLRGHVEIGRWAVSARRSLVADVVYAVRMSTLGRTGRQDRYQREGRT
jgi:glycosyltransferase involved in cell wall biosynthesis